MCNSIRLVNILCNYAASEQKRFLKGLENNFTFYKENVVQEKFKKCSE